MKRIQIGSLVIHDTDLGAEAVGYRVTDPIGGISLPSSDMTSYPVAGGHGEVIANNLWRGRVVAFKGGIVATDPLDFRTKQDALYTVLRIAHDSEGLLIPQTIYLTDDVGTRTVQMNGEVMDGTEVTVETVAVANFQLLFKCGDPFFQGGALNTQTIQLATGGGAIYPVVYPVIYGATTGGSATITNAGTADSYPVIKLSGPLTNPRVYNQTTGYAIAFTYTIPLGSQIVVDMAAESAMLNGTIPIEYAFTSSSRFWVLEPGNNTIKFTSQTSVDTGNCVVEWRDGYSGI